MILFFRGQGSIYYAIESKENALTKEIIPRLEWLLSNAKLVESSLLEGYYIGPRVEMITPWSTNAVEITRNMGIQGISRMEMLKKADHEGKDDFDRMLEHRYYNPGQQIFAIDKTPEPVTFVFDISAYNEEEGLALSKEEINYLEDVCLKIGRKLTDTEVYGFAQINSEHCRHKIFNGDFIIDGEKMPESLFGLIKKTTRQNPNLVVSAYNDNVAFIDGGKAGIFAPLTQHQPDYFDNYTTDTVISIKAETHNFPTTVEPFNGAATGSGGEIRDRMAGGKGSFPIAGSAVYFTSYPRLDKSHGWETKFPERPWLYQSPAEILIKASNGASDFGNKFGQPLINGSLLTFEFFEGEKQYGFDKVVMLAGGVGFAKKADSQKGHPQQDDRIVITGGDNYRIGMGGGAVSSVATGEFDNSIELNAVQRSNPEMQKRVANILRALAEMKDNPIVSIHDHGAGGHLNCISELVEECGGEIDMAKLPVGDPTLSSREILGNESQERMGLVLKEEHYALLEKIAERERAPLYNAGRCSGDQHLTFTDKDGKRPVNLDMAYLFGNPPRTTLEDKSLRSNFGELSYDSRKLSEYIEELLQLEAVACKDWLTNKVDRSVTGKIATQQCTGEIQLPLNNLGVVSIDHDGTSGIATALGHAPAAALIDPGKGSRLAVTEALTNLVWASLSHGLKGVSLSANWMWPAKYSGENARLYQAVKAISDFCLELGINIPTGKDSLSMVQKYPDGKTVMSPGTVIVSAVSPVDDIRRTVTPVLKPVTGSGLIFIDFSSGEGGLGGSSFAQVLGQIGNDAPDSADAGKVKRAFGVIQKLIGKEKILAGHDVGSGGLITTLLEMCFPQSSHAMEIDLKEKDSKQLFNFLFTEAPAVIIQVENRDDISAILDEENISYKYLGTVIPGEKFRMKAQIEDFEYSIPELRDSWFRTSALLDARQTRNNAAERRFENYKSQKLDFIFPEGFDGSFKSCHADKERKNKSGIRAAIIREKGVNGDREMAHVMYRAGFDVKDVHMTDLISGREDLSDINFIVFVGGFSNSDVLGSAKGWAGAFMYNDKAKAALDNFYARNDTLSLGVCNGCQLMMELGLIYPEIKNKPGMHLNESGKFESAFLSVDILENNSVMLNTLSGSRLGIWVAHGEGRFQLDNEESSYQIPMKFTYSDYPGNPNGSDYGTAALCSSNGRHLAMMPHLERSYFPWQWAYYPANRPNDEIAPWFEAFVNARIWIEKR